MEKKAMISQPMNGRTRHEILEERKRVSELLEEKGFEVIDTFFTDDMQPLEHLGRSICAMAYVDCVAFVPGWEEARGCRIEHECAYEYGKQIITIADGF